MTPLVMIASMVVVAILFVAEATRRGAKWMMAATAVVSAWIGLTALAFRASNQFQAGEAVQNYAVVMTIVLFVYFRSGVVSERKSSRRPQKTPGDAATEPPVQEPLT